VKRAKKRARQLKKQRLLKRERRAARLATAEQRAEKARKRAAAQRLILARQVAAASQSRPADRGHSIVPVLALTILGALLMLGLGFVPSTAVPRSRVSAVLEEHHGHFTLVGGMILLGVAVFFALTLVTR
jgi:hypothetical protein